MSRANSQLSLPPMPVAKGTHEASARGNHTQEEAERPKETHAHGHLTAEDAHAMAARIFDEALTDARITTAECAHLLGISESLVRRMRSGDARERVAFAQMLRLPPAFHIAMHRAMNRRFGFARAALSQLIDAAGALAVLVTE